MTVVESFLEALRGRPVEKFTVYIPDQGMLRDVWQTDYWYEGWWCLA